MNRTLSQFLADQRQSCGTDSALTDTVAAVAAVCTDISAQVRLGSLAGILGEAGSGNIQGEAQKKLDVTANRILLDTLRRTPAVAGAASEEEEHAVPCCPDGRYLVLFDPLDGSSNIDVDISVGTIFSVLPKPEGSLNDESFLQAGENQLVAGYALYGPQTLLVLTFGQGVHLFTLDNGGQFVETQSGLRIPERTAEFAVNMSNRRHWEPPVRRYIDELLDGETGVRGKNYNMRWVASMVAEVHRILMRGGVFLYPKDARNPDRAGKLRLMYEANPLGLLVEQAGGLATDARRPTLAIRPEGLHQRVAVVLGSREEVERIRLLHEEAA